MTDLLIVGGCLHVLIPGTALHALVNIDRGNWTDSGILIELGGTNEVEGTDATYAADLAALGAVITDVAANGTGVTATNLKVAKSFVTTATQLPAMRTTIT